MLHFNEDPLKPERDALRKRVLARINGQPGGSPVQNFDGGVAEGVNSMFRLQELGATPPDALRSGTMMDRRGEVQSADRIIPPVSPTLARAIKEYSQAEARLARGKAEGLGDAAKVARTHVIARFGGDLGRALAGLPASEGTARLIDQMIALRAEQAISRRDAEAKSEAGEALAERDIAMIEDDRALKEIDAQRAATADEREQERLRLEKVRLKESLRQAQEADTQRVQDNLFREAQLRIDQERVAAYRIQAENTGNRTGKTKPGIGALFTTRATQGIEARTSLEEFDRMRSKLNSKDAEDRQSAEQWMYENVPDYVPGYDPTDPVNQGAANPNTKAVTKFRKELMQDVDAAVNSYAAVLDDVDTSDWDDKDLELHTYVVTGRRPPVPEPPPPEPWKGPMEDGPIPPRDIPIEFEGSGITPEMYEARKAKERAQTIAPEREGVVPKAEADTTGTEPKEPDYGDREIQIERGDTTMTYKVWEAEYLLNTLKSRAAGTFDEDSRMRLEGGIAELEQLIQRAKSN